MHPVRSLAIRGIESIDCEENIQTAAQIMRDKKIGSLIVTKEREMVGILTETDLARRGVAQGLIPNEHTVGSIMSSPIISIDAQSTAEMANDMMWERGLRHLAVSENGKIVGLSSHGIF